jgi:chorismate synthase
MSSTFGTLFRITTFGESHGAGVGVLVDGMLPGFAVDTDAIQRELDRRRPGQSAITTPRQEADRVEIVSGVLDGVALGTPILMLVRNTDARSKDYGALKDVYRPGHADFVYEAKYGVRDHRGGGRSSGRETVGRVAAGALARTALATLGVRIVGGTVRVGDVEATRRDWDQVEANPVRCPDAEAAERMRTGDRAGEGRARLHRRCGRGAGDRRARGLGRPDHGQARRPARGRDAEHPGHQGGRDRGGFEMTRRRGSETNDVFDGERYASNFAGWHRGRDLERQRGCGAGRHPSGDEHRPAAGHGPARGRDRDRDHRGPP